ncbi:MAG: hypothetical protein H5T69_14600 [Chloroflexi bacterium]|nr:hypothetical protein [Chloroflexota bacterium]
MNTDIKGIFKLSTRDPAIWGGVGVLIIGVALLILTALSFVRLTAERRTLAAEVESARDSLEQMREIQKASPESLRQKLEETRAQLATLLDALPREQEATEELARYYDYAQLYSTQLVRLETLSSLSGGPEGQEPLYGIERFTLEARGVVPHLLRFLGHIAAESFQTFVFDNLTVGPDGPAVGRADLDVLYALVTPVPTTQPPASLQPQGRGALEGRSVGETSSGGQVR